MERPHAQPPELESRRTIAVFGSSRPQPGSPEYEEARAVGRLLADAGYAVATGGYVGTMEAVSCGAAQVGGYVIGVGSAQIERFRPGGLNEWVSEAIFYETLRERLYHLVVNNMGMIVLPGGIGTLSELALAWSLLQVGEVEPRPLILMGELWRETMRTFIRSQFVPPDHAELLRFADTPDEAVAHVLRWSESPR